ncbi:molecular chaperone HtpG [Paraliomyxa miuraensis]|uniref:molecular chaperone HtpG n=1 Tax=Paraliomyxa miuraensis TaxID=376150 RepID=UPI002251E3C5|nr:molecular chaperone HtpG [Paraliomyxa miuraensis]MCX4243408.1 molecular chaperone HtpG [Paraliomyxa miuraensis]
MSDATNDSATASGTHEFKAEVAAVLRLVTNSLYTNREIFLRELVSNASDALDKARFVALVDKDLRDQELTPHIQIIADQARGVLVIEDVGIGMSEQEATQNLGTIAHSGTLRFLEQAATEQAEGKRPDLDLIGQFGVGFYSAFMVADRIDVHSLSARPGHEPIHWSSDGTSFSIGPSARKLRGTRIELHLKDDAKEFLDRWRIEGIVKRYSNFVLYPIKLQRVDDKGVNDGDNRQINAASAFWTRSAKDVSDDDYKEFYTHVMGGFVLPGDEPLARLHLSLDAPIQFKAVLYVPGRRPPDLFNEDAKALQLYARRVLVMESCDKLLPTYLRFVRGVVDSEDLPLNVSREMLQEHQSLAAIRRQLTRKVLKLLEDTATDEPENYARLWEEFGVFIKEGLHTDNAHREQITGLLRFASTGSDGKLVSLHEYVEAMPEGQEAIYYITGDSTAALARSPHLEAVRARGYAVLLMTDAVDEWVVQDLREHEGKPLRSVTQGGDLGLSKDANETKDGDEPSAEASDIDPLLRVAKQVLGDRVKEVRASSRLTDSTACLVDDEGGLSRNMERILRMANRDVPTRPRILELNPGHAFVRAANELAAASLEAAPEAGSEPPQPLRTWVELLHDQANLAEGTVADPAGVVLRIQSLLDRVAGLRTEEPTP